MKRTFLLAFLLITMPQLAVAATDVALAPLDVIHMNGELRAMNGSRLCELYSTGYFLMLTLGESGEDIEGKWEVVDSKKGLTVRVHGRWGQLNQANRGDDFRTMTLVIEPGVLHDTGHPGEDFYSCKFVEKDVKADPGGKETWAFRPIKMEPLPRWE